MIIRPAYITIFEEKYPLKIRKNAFLKKDKVWE
jgi:hypothetical protein